jgi:lipopolysaccharide/colanic/teichoic acid biosynthesis glycosyltransferase
MHVARSRDVLQHVLEIERARADRSGKSFYWVLFRFGNPHFADGAVERLSDTVAARARMTDVVGRFDDASVCAVLPETDSAGAKRFAADVLRLARQQHLNAEAVVYSYPAAPQPDDFSNDQFSPTRSPGSGDRLLMPVPAASTDPVNSDVKSREALAMKEHLLLHMPLWKRASDVLGAIIGLFLAFPILLAAAIAVKISSPGPVFFIQRRVGLGGRPFAMYKFRSMYVGADKRKHDLLDQNERDGPAFKMKNDPRVTPVGHYLRRCSIDELPQLYNVLKGEMSLVGPRPPTFDEVLSYRSWYTRRFDVTPGITCIWQVRGRTDVTFESWMRMDMQYIRNYGFWQDVRLLLATIPAVLSRRGAH